MKVKGDKAPPNAFTIEEQPNKPGYVLVRFYENVAPYEETRETTTIKGFEYDEYYLEFKDDPGLADSILENFVELLENAKEQEEARKAVTKTLEKLEADVAYMAMMIGVDLDV